MTAVLVVSDTHWPAAGSDGNWRAVRRWLEGADIDLVVHAGDATVDGAGDAAQLDLAAGVLGDLSQPWRIVPGNHDLGDTVPGHRHRVTAGRQAAWTARFGPGVWRCDLGSWAIVGIDAQLVGSGLAAEGEQWAQLGDLAAGLDGRPVALVTHKPLHAASPGERRAAPKPRYLPEGTHRRLRDVLGCDPTLVVSGHVHQYRELVVGGARQVWAPSTWAAIPDAVQPVVGRKRTGAVVVDLADDGTTIARLLEPEGLEQHVIGTTVPSPY